MVEFRCPLTQVEQQDAILTQLQNELRAERDRHQETSCHLQNARRTNSDLEDALETNQKEIKDLSNKVSVGQGLSVLLFYSSSIDTVVFFPGPGLSAITFVSFLKIVLLL